jgi:hypothetical protein
MSNGDPIRAGEQTIAFQTTCMFAEAQNFNFPTGSPMYFVGAPINVGNITTTDLDCLVARGNQCGGGVIGWGGIDQGTGVIGAGGVNFVASESGSAFIQQGGVGVEGDGGPGSPGYTLGAQVTPGQTYQPIEGGAGVLGYGGAGANATAIPDNATDGVAANPGLGVFGRGGDANGAPLPGSGAVGVAPDPSFLGSPYYIFRGNGVAGVGPTGVYGFSTEGVGVLGGTYAPDRAAVVGINFLNNPKAIKGAAGVLGLGPVGGQGVTGQVFVSNTSFDSTTMAVRGTVTGNPKMGANGPYAGWFDGPVHITGDLTVAGAKSVAIPFADGSLRRLYCMESPECWFEDFGDAKLVKGKAQVKLPRDFAAAIKTDAYHVFLSPYGGSNGIYVSKRTREGFVVEEQGGGKSSLTFSFRIVGKRKDVKAERFAKMGAPKGTKASTKAGAKAPPLPSLPQSIERKKKEAEPNKKAFGTRLSVALANGPRPRS